MPIEDSFTKKLSQNFSYIRDVCLSILLLCVLALHYLKVFPTSIGYWVLISSAVIGILPIFWNAIISFKEGEWASMDMLASFALIFSVVSGQWASAIFITLMITSARILEELNEEKAKKSIKGLLKLKPKEAKVQKDGRVQVIPVEQIQIGDLVIVDIGERIPIDGKVVSGEGTTDESSLTGESLPVEKTIGSKVASSTLVVSGSITIQTEKIGKDTTLEKIIALVQDAREQKPEVEGVGAKFGKIYLVSMFIGSLVLLLVTKDVSFVLAVVLVVCADDIAIAIPIAYLRAIGFAASHGIIVKGGKHLETMGEIDIVVFDKTGTLTIGKPSISSIEPALGFTKDDVLKNGAIAAIRSTHPLARALVLFAQEQKVQEVYPDSATVVSGRGVIAQKDNTQITMGNKVFFEKYNLEIEKELLDKAIACGELGESVSYIAVDNKTIGFFSAADTPKPNVAQVIEHLKKLGIKKVVMLTGDNEKAAAAMAQKMGITDFYANLLPEDKVNKLKELQKIGKVAMIGDGVNDASALSIAHVGIAMGALGTDGAIESAEIVLMNDNLESIPKIIRIARKVHRIAIQDFWIWGITNIGGLSLVFLGFIGPTGAAAYNFISDFFPLLNSARAKVKS